MAVRLFDRTDLADWELSVEVGVCTLELPSLPSPRTVHVLPLPRYVEGWCQRCGGHSLTLCPTENLRCITCVEDVRSV